MTMSEISSTDHAAKKDQGAAAMSDEIELVPTFASSNGADTSDEVELGDSPAGRKRAGRGKRDDHKAPVAKAGWKGIATVMVADGVCTVPFERA